MFHGEIVLARAGELLPEDIDVGYRVHCNVAWGTRSRRAASASEYISRCKMLTLDTRRFSQRPAQLRSFLSGYSVEAG
jgi:hypothetical protein